MAMETWSCKEVHSVVLAPLGCGTAPTGSLLMPFLNSMLRGHDVQEHVSTFVDETDTLSCNICHRDQHTVLQRLSQTTNWHCNISPKGKHLTQQHHSKSTNPHKLTRLFGFYWQNMPPSKWKGYILQQVCTNPGYQVSHKTKVCWSSTWNLRHVIILALTILRWLLRLWESCAFI